MKKRDTISLYLDWISLDHIEYYQRDSVPNIKFYTSDNYVNAIKERYEIDYNPEFFSLSELHLKVLIMGYCKENGIGFRKTKKIIYPILKSEKGEEFIIWLREELMQSRLPLYDELFSKVNEICDWKEPVIKRRKRNGKKRWRNINVYLKWLGIEYKKIFIDDFEPVFID